MKEYTEALKILDDNYNGDRNSFIDQLHEKDIFNINEFRKLCNSIETLSKTCKGNSKITVMVVFVYTQTLKHILYNFDPKDCSEISNLPENYSEYIELIDYVIFKYLHENN